MGTPIPRPAPEGTRYESVLRQTLACALSPDVVDLVLLHALDVAGTQELPTDPAGFVFFVLGSLDPAVERRAGRNTADALLRELEPLLDEARGRVRGTATISGLAPKSESPPPPTNEAPTKVASGVHPRFDLDDLSSTVGAEPAEAATFLVASADGWRRDALRRTLQREGHRVVGAHDGHVGLALCVRYQPDVVICDLDMPRVSGRELVSSIKLALGRGMPRVIMLTPEPGERLADVFHQIPRPVHPDVLRDVVARALADL